MIACLNQVTRNTEQMLVKLADRAKVEQNDLVVHICAIAQTNQIVTKVRIGLHLAPFEDFTHCNFQRGFT